MQDGSERASAAGGLVRKRLTDPSEENEQYVRISECRQRCRKLWSTVCKMPLRNYLCSRGSIS
ncbi:hypothetical protein K432DRAFT_377830 [Lepidopterella palustris CBS 459.81]|uniref:Uncharacterized protein n=1 Tax=Lepidopterella palustris CBS 459.81 TaxID=1314670 RepID=A0A8E2EJM7_9PEZI|nr:hypothetical protein K432DRAFT_377830 [Lepidopterella palustris CBS 459.81]